MASQKQGLYLFPEVEEITEDLTDAQFGELMRAAFAYRFRGEAYEGTDPLLRMAFRMISGQIQRGEQVRRRKKEAADARWHGKAEQSEEDTMQKDAEPMHEDAEDMQSDAPIQSNPIQSIPVQSIPDHSVPVRSVPAASGRRTPPGQRSSYGKFGWIRLKPEEYAALEQTLGKDELHRCIDYLDETAQATGNRNKYKDWAVVIRRCSREGWGIRNRNAPPKGASGNLGDAELEAIRRVMQHPVSQEI